MRWKHLQEWNKHNGRWRHGRMYRGHHRLCAWPCWITTWKPRARAPGALDKCSFHLIFIEFRNACTVTAEMKSGTGLLLFGCIGKQSAKAQSQGLFQQNKAWATNRKTVARNCHQNTATFTKGEEREKPMSMCMERYWGEKASWCSRCNKRPCLAEVKGKASWQMANVTNVPCGKNAALVNVL